MIWWPPHGRYQQRVDRESKLNEPVVRVPIPERPPRLVDWTVSPHPGAAERELRRRRSGHSIYKDPQKPHL